MVNFCEVQLQLKNFYCPLHILNNIDVLIRVAFAWIILMYSFGWHFFVWHLTLIWILVNTLHISCNFSIFIKSVSFFPNWSQTKLIALQVLYITVSTANQRRLHVIFCFYSFIVFNLIIEWSTCHHVHICIFLLFVYAAACFSLAVNRQKNPTN